MQPIIRFENVTVIAQAKTLLAAISFEIYQGEIAVLCGKSGAGKSTLLKTLLGFYPISSGSISVDSRVLNSKTIHAIRCHCAYISQEPVMGAVTVQEALLLPFQFKAHQESAPSTAKINSVLDRLVLPKTLLSQDCQKLSGGEKQRLAIARGLLLGQSLYLLDEFTSALDADSKQSVFNIFTDSKLTVLSISHDPDWLLHCQVSLRLDAGQLLEVNRHAHT